MKIANAFEWYGQPPEIAPFPLGICTPSSTWFLRYLDRFSHFLYGSQMLCCAMNYKWEENPQNCPLPLGFDFVTPPEEARGTAIGNMRVWFGRYARRQRDNLTHTQKCSLQYFATILSNLRRSGHFHRQGKITVEVVAAAVLVLNYLAIQEQVADSCLTGLKGT